MLVVGGGLLCFWLACACCVYCLGVVGVVGFFYGSLLVIRCV